MLTNSLEFEVILGIYDKFKNLKQKKGLFNFFSKEEKNFLAKDILVKKVFPLNNVIILSYCSRGDFVKQLEQQFINFNSTKKYHE